MTTNEATPEEQEMTMDDAYIQSKLMFARLTALPKDRAIFVDNKPFTVQREMHPHMIRALVSKDLQYQVFLERGAPPDWTRDLHIPPRVGETIQIEDGMRFYTVPPAGFGTGRGLMSADSPSPLIEGIQI